jgi:hypothetical protein
VLNLLAALTTAFAFNLHQWQFLREIKFLCEVVNPQRREIGVAGTRGMKLYPVTALPFQRQSTSLSSLGGGKPEIVTDQPEEMAEIGRLPP